MFFYEGQSCPVCHKHFAESDDIVACPQCGCPHHRGCWEAEGHCHFEADHGTKHQWAQGSPGTTDTSHSAPSSRCPHCGTHNPEFAEFCAQCGKEIRHDDWHSQATPPPPVGQYTPPAGNYTPPFSSQPFQVPLQDPYGGVSREERIEEVPVDDIVELIGPNSAYYLPRFLKMSRGGSKVSWNWAAFLIPYNWLLFRKNTLWGILTFVFASALSVIGQLAILPMEEYLSQLTPDTVYTLMNNPTMQLLGVVMFITSLLDIALRVLTGLFGNYLYYHTILKKARRLHQPQPLYNRNFRTVGGTSFALAIAPELFSMFCMYALMLVGI